MPADFRKVTFGSDDPMFKTVCLDGRPVGHIKPAKQGDTLKGWFLHLDGKTWQNAAPGARYSQEKDFRAPYTFCKSLKQVIERVRANIPMGGS